MKNSIFTTLLNNRIKVFFEDTKIDYLTSEAADEIENLIRLGFNKGKVITVVNEKKIFGDWEVIDWQSIALALYSAKTVKQKEMANQLFLENFCD